MSVILGPSVEPIPGYRLIERLGRGGFGEVWKAEAPGGLLKAIKFVFGDLNTTGDGEPAEQELKSLERVKTIRHPYILSLERYDIVEGQLLIVMELADRNLWDRYRECRTQNLPGIPKQELLGYLEEAAEALDLMNTQYQLQHLDIKPQNMFLVYNHIKVADFGLVKDFEGKRGTITGGVTPVYAAPETFEGWVSRNSDQYSLAIVYQELLTGQRPFNGTTAHQLLFQHLQKEPDTSALNETDRVAVRRALSKTPDDRFPSCMDFVHALWEGPTGPRYATPSGAVPEPPKSSGTAARLITTPTPAPAQTEHLGPSVLQSTTALPGGPATQARVRGNTTLAHPQLEPLELPSAPISKKLDDETGALTPAVVVGLGGVGGRVLRLLRAAIIERFGPEPVPNVRLMAVDTDATALRALTSDYSVPLTVEEVFHTGLNRPSHYLKGELVGVDTWLGASTLYRLPKHPASAELRAFGRLALLDHGAALGRRLRSELEASRNGAALAMGERTTGLGIRSEKPRVFVVASLAGGAGSGMFLDMAYLIRSILRQIGDHEPNVTAVLLLPPGERGATPAPLANTYAALTELSHFCEPDEHYTGRFLPKGARETDTGVPYQRVVLLPLGAQPDSAEATASYGQAAGLLVRELLTMIGPTAERQRELLATGRTPCVVPAQTAATFHLSWPRQRLARVAARRLGQELITRWTAKDATPLREGVKRYLDEHWDLRGLHPDRLAEQLHQKLSAQIGMAATDRIEALIGPLLDPRQPQKTDSHEYYAAIDQLVRLLGAIPGYLIDGPAGRIPSIFATIGPELAKACDQQVADLAIHSVERPGIRITGTEELIRQLAEKLQQALTSYQSLSQSLSKEATEQFRTLFPMIAGLERYALTAKRQVNFLQELQHLMRSYPKKQYQSLLANSLAELYRGMLGAIPDYLHEVHFCRDRLAESANELQRRTTAEPDLDSAQGPGRHLLPNKLDSLNDAASNVVNTMSPKGWDDFDTRVQKAVIERFQSLVNFCLAAGPRPEQLAELLEREGETYFEIQLPSTNPADMLIAAGSDELHDEMAAAIAACHPPLAGPKAAVESLITIVGAPDTGAGRRVQQAAAGGPDVAFATCPSGDEVVIYRELRHLDLADLPQCGPVGLEAYEKALAEGTALPHSRLDIEWQAVK